MSEDQPFHRPISRRRFLMRSAQVGLGLTAAGITIAGILAQQRQRPWDPNAFPPPGKARVAILKASGYNEPLERDLTTYAVIAHEMLEGKALYSELWDHKPPAIHVTYAAAELIPTLMRA